MPKTTKDLYTQAKDIRAKADELLKLQAATNAFSTLEMLEREYELLKRDYDRTVKSITGYEYDITALDKKHPNYEEKKKTLQETLASMMVSRDDYQRRMETKGISLERENVRVKEQIAKIESGEINNSSMAKGQLVKELVNKLSYEG